MNRRIRASALLPAALLAAALTAGCAHSGGSAAPAAPSSATSGAAPAPDPSELAHMQKLVDGAESAVATAESDAAHDK